MIKINLKGQNVPAKNGTSLTIDIFELRCKCSEGNSTVEFYDIKFHVNSKIALFQKSAKENLLILIRSVFQSQSQPTLTNILVQCSSTI